MASAPSQKAAHKPRYQFAVLSHAVALVSFGQAQELRSIDWETFKARRTQLTTIALDPLQYLELPGRRLVRALALGSTTWQL